MDAARLAEQLLQALHMLDAGIEIDPGDIDLGLAHITSYADGGYLTEDAGFVATGDDGSQVQVTVRQTRLPRPT